MRMQPAAFIAALCASILLAGCAAQTPRAPRLERLPADAATGTPSASISIPDLVSLARNGASPDALVEAWRNDGARLPLGAADLVELHARGVSVAHLDALLAARELALRTDYETRLAAQRANADAALAAERSRVQACPVSYGPYPYWGPFPYAGWGSGGGWYGGLRFGW